MKTVANLGQNLQKLNLTVTIDPVISTLIRKQNSQFMAKTLIPAG